MAMQCDASYRYEAKLMLTISLFVFTTIVLAKVSMICQMRLVWGTSLTLEDERNMTVLYGKVSLIKIGEY